MNGWAARIMSSPRAVSRLVSPIGRPVEVSGSWVSEPDACPAATGVLVGAAVPLVPSTSSSGVGVGWVVGIGATVGVAAVDGASDALPVGVGVGVGVTGVAVGVGVDVAASVATGSGASVGVGVAVGV